MNNLLHDLNYFSFIDFDDNSDSSDKSAYMYFDNFWIDKDGKLCGAILLPGFTKDEVTLEIEGEYIIISAKMKDAKRFNGVFHSQKRLRFIVPEVFIGARYIAELDNGVLSISASPRKQKPSRTKITIN